VALLTPPPSIAKNASPSRSLPREDYTSSPFSKRSSDKKNSGRSALYQLDHILPGYDTISNTDIFIGTFYLK